MHLQLLCSHTCTKWTRDPSHKYGLPRVQRLRSIHHKITVIQVPRADLDLSGTQNKQVSALENKLDCTARRSRIKVTQRRGAPCSLRYRRGSERVCVPTDRLVFDGGAGHTEVQLAVLFNAGIDQSLH